MPDGPKEPSVRGSLFVMAVVAVRRHRESGAISEDGLLVRLGPAALELLEHKIEIDRWYPMAAFSEMTDIDWEISGRRAPDYMREMGRDAAARFLRTGIYQQLDYAKRSRRAQSQSSLVRQAKLIITVSAALYSFIETEVVIEQGVLRIVYANAALFGEAFRYTTEGFMNEVNRHQGASRSWTSERVAPDRIFFELELPEWLSESR